MDDPEHLRRLAADAGFATADVRTRTLSLRLPPPADFFWPYVHSTPLAGLVGPRDEETKAALEDDVVARCRPFRHGVGLLLELDLLVTTARRD